MKNITLIIGTYGEIDSCFVKLHAEKGGNLILVGKNCEKLEK